MNFISQVMFYHPPCRFNPGYEVANGGLLHEEEKRKGERGDG
jgi:hypothetical protein